MKSLLAVLFILLALCGTAVSQTVIKMQKRGDIFLIPSRINGLPLDFIFDTGATDVSISLTEARFMLKNGYLSEDDLLGITHYSLANGDVAEGTQILLKRIEIGEVRLNNVKASIIHNSNAPLLMGQSALRMLGNISIDYETSSLTIHRSPANNISIHELRGTLGIEGKREGLKSQKGVEKETNTVSERPAFDVSGWSMASLPSVNDDSDETGKIVFKITVDSEGEITRIQQVSSTLSPAVSELYRKAVARVRLRPKGGDTPPTATGTITFIVKQKE